MRRPNLLVTAAGERERDDREPGDVVDAVTAVPVGNYSVGVLYDPDVVGEREQMVAAQARQVQLGDSCGPSPRRELVCFLQDGGRCFCDGGPGEREPIRCASARAATSVSGRSR